MEICRGIDLCNKIFVCLVFCMSFLAVCRPVCVCVCVFAFAYACVLINHLQFYKQPPPPLPIHCACDFLSVI